MSVLCFLSCINFWEKSYFLDAHTGNIKIEKSILGIRSCKYTGQSCCYKPFDQYLNKDLPPLWLFMHGCEGSVRITRRSCFGPGTTCLDYLKNFQYYYDNNLGKDRTQYYLNQYMQEMIKDKKIVHLDKNKKALEILEAMEKEIKQLPESNNTDTLK